MFWRLEVRLAQRSWVDRLAVRQWKIPTIHLAGLAVDFRRRACAAPLESEIEFFTSLELHAMRCDCIGVSAG